MSASYEGKSVIRAIEWSGSRMEGFTGHSDGMINFFNGKNGHPICNLWLFLNYYFNFYKIQK